MQEKKREIKIPRIGSEYKAKNQFFSKFILINRKCQIFNSFIFEPNSTAQHTAHAQFYERNRFVVAFCLPRFSELFFVNHKQIINNVQQLCELNSLIA